MQETDSNIGSQGYMPEATFMKGIAGFAQPKSDKIVTTAGI